MDPQQLYRVDAFHLLVGAGVEPTTGGHRRLSSVEIERFVARALADPPRRQRLVSVWARSVGPRASTPEQNLAAARRWLLQGLIGWPARLLLLQRLPDAPAAELPPALISSPRAPEPVRDEESAWLEFEVKHGDDEYGAGLAYKLELAPDDVRHGKLDRMGYAFVDRIDPGSYRLTIGEPPPPEPPPEIGFLDLQLLDDTGRPLAGVKYRVDVAGAAPREGHLDASGRAHLAGLPEGVHTVSFPELDQSFVVRG